jgi:Tfp pilus assembly protein PilF
MSVPIRNASGRFYLDAGRLREAQSEFLASVKIDADMNEAGWAGLAEAYTQQELPKKAEPAWQRVLASNPFDSHAHLELARIYLATERSAEAEKEFEGCLLTDPNNREALSAIQKLHLQ